MAIQKPKIFISSTIADFRDLRSALEYWFEQLGYQVFLSEKNDFPKALDKNDLDACFGVIEQADYFVLLIGGRVGSLYDATKRESITRLEYRHAYELMKAGKLRLAIFVRHDLWTVRQDRKALAEYLATDYAAQKELGEDAIRSILAHPSPFVTDAQMVSEFIGEVTREEESRRAAAGEGAHPPGNWVHPFSSFEQIIEALRTEFKITDGLAEIALRANLRQELIANLRHLTHKIDGHICPTADFLLFQGKRFLTGDLTGTSVMPRDARNGIAMYCVVASAGERLTTDFIDQALASGAFMAFDRERSEYKSTEFSKGLISLSRTIRDHKRALIAVHDQLLRIQTTISELASSNGTARMSNLELLPAFGIGNREHNILSLCRGLVRALDGCQLALSDLDLYPSSPFTEEARRMGDKEISTDEIEDWIRNAPPRPL